jgi:hypothetical protein
MMNGMATLYECIFACLMIAFLYGLYYIDLNVLYYATLCTIVVVCLLYAFSKKVPVKRRHSDYENDTPIESFA